MVIERKEYQVYVKEMAPWEPDVADEGSFVEDESGSRGCFECFNGVSLITIHKIMKGIMTISAMRKQKWVMKRIV